MVKRRRLEAPSTDDLTRIEAEFRSETFDRAASVRGIAPIAQVPATIRSGTVLNVTGRSSSTLSSPAVR